MAVELRVPQVGESITEVQIGEWLKKEGESVTRDETVVMIETDKVTVELPAPVSGVISKITHATGTVAAVGDVIGFMEEGDGAAVAAEAGAVSAPAPTTATSAPTSIPAAPAAPAPAPAPAADTPAAAAPRVMPAAQRALHDSGMTPSQVTPTGPGGRVLKEDVMRVAAPAAAPAPAARPAPPPAAPAPAPAPAPAESAAGYRQEEAVPLSPLRRRLAQRLVHSQQTAALLTTFNEIDMSAVMATRKEYQPVFQERYGIKLGFMSFFVKAAIDALKLIPQVNAEMREDDILYRNYFDIGVAVGGGKGLVVPVIRNAERLSFAEVELSIADFGTRAKSNKLTLADMTGGTFTISNGGVYGSLMSTPIVNPPQSGILGLHGIQDRPIALAGKVEIRPMMYIALTYDHRVVDGREAVTFLKRIKECVEAPTRMLIEV